MSVGSLCVPACVGRFSNSFFAAARITLCCFQVQSVLLPLSHNPTLLTVLKAWWLSCRGVDGPGLVVKFQGNTTNRPFETWNVIFGAFVTVT